MLVALLGKIEATNLKVSFTFNDIFVVFNDTEVGKIGSTVTLQFATIPFTVVADIVALPIALATTLPLSTVTISVFDDFHTIFLSVAFSGKMVALNLNYFNFKVKLVCL